MSIRHKEFQEGKVNRQVCCVEDFCGFPKIKVDLLAKATFELKFLGAC